VDVLGFSIVLPLLPYLSTHYGMTPLLVGLLQSSNALSQLVAVPVIGTFSDKWGRKPLLLICVTSTLISFVILAMADNMWMVFISRIVDGLCGGNISLAQAYIADITSERDRSQGMGILGAGFGLGFIVGPALGGILVNWNYSYPIYCAIVLSTINLIGVFFLPESLPKEKRGKRKDFTDITTVFSKLWECLKQKKLAVILLLRFTYLIVFTIFESAFGYFNMKLGLDARWSSYALCYYGAFFSVVQGAIRRLKNRHSEKSLFDIALVLQVLFYLLHGLVYTSSQMFVTLLFLGLSSGLLQTLITSRVSCEIEPALLGGGLGVSAALGSLARIVAPPLSGAIIDVEYLGVYAPFIVCSILSVCMILIEKFINN